MCFWRGMTEWKIPADSEGSESTQRKGVAAPSCPSSPLNAMPFLTCPRIDFNPSFASFLLSSFLLRYPCFLTRQFSFLSLRLLSFSISEFILIPPSLPSFSHLFFFDILASSLISFICFSSPYVTFASFLFFFRVSSRDIIVSLLISFRFFLFTFCISAFKNWF